MWQRMLQGGGTASKEIVELVPVLSSNNGTNGRAFLYNASQTVNDAWYAFNKIYQYSNMVGFATSTDTKICYEFNTPQKVTKFGAMASPEYGYYASMKYQLYYSDNGTTWFSASKQVIFTFNEYEMQYTKSTETSAHKYWGVQVYNPTRSDTFVCGIQFFDTNNNQ